MHDRPLRLILRCMIAQAILLVGPSISAAQWLRLSSAPSPPRTIEPTTTTRALAELAQELDRLTLARSAASGDQRVIVDAFIAHRQAAIALLEASRDGDAPDDRSWVAAMRLVEARRSIDRSLQSLLDRDERDAHRSRALHHLRATFRPDEGRSDQERLRQEPDTTTPGRTGERRTTVARQVEALEPIAGALVLATGQPLPPAWPLVRPGTRLPRPWSPEQVADRDTIRMRAEELESGILREMAIAAVAQIAPTAPLPWPVDEARLRALRGCLSVGAALDRAAWLDRSVRERLEAQVAAIISSLPTASRSQAEAIDAETGSITILLDQLHRAATDPRRTRSLEPVTKHLDALLFIDARHEPRLRQVRVLVGRVLEGMSRFHEIDMTLDSPALAPARAALTRAYRLAEAQALEAVPALAVSEEPIVDPGLVSVLSAPVRFLDDLGRLGRLGELEGALARVSAGADTAMRPRLEALCLCLDDQARRPAAVAAMAELERQIGLFEELPSEERLRSGSFPLAGDAPTQRALINAIDARRVAWAEAWSNGITGGRAGDRLARLVRLMSTLSDLERCAAAPAPDHPAVVLEGWAPWWMDPEALRRRTAQAMPAAREAVNAAIEGDDSGLDAVLELLELDAAVPRLACRLADRLRDALPPQTRDPAEAAAVPGPDQASLRACAALLPRPPGAWRPFDDRTLATMCRAVHELDRAGDGWTKTDRAAAATYADELAMGLLRDVVEPIDALPTLTLPTPPPQPATERPGRRR